MKKRTAVKIVTSLLLVAMIGAFMVGCGTDSKSNTATPATSPEASKSTKNTNPIVVTWYPNESS
ncbi:MAG TPA: hypothetical protein PKJ65_02700, partial [Clostridia bacterium]|nr:hypothetical protein [Clostridia bacterium]